MVLLLVYCGLTTAQADFPVEAAAKWAWVWKSMVFAIFLPLTLRTRLRFEALALIMILCASSIIVTGGIKTILAGGGYGVLNLMVDDNSGLYEGSTISMVAIAIIPLILWLAKHGTIFAPSRMVRVYALALCGACLLIPIGTETRTGLLCIVLLSGLMVWRSKHRVAFGVAAVALALVAVPFLPSSFTNRMNTIENYQGDESASTRIAVWRWTLDYVKTHPAGGGFDAYRSNSFTYDSVRMVGEPGSETVVREHVIDKGRAYHSAYFEVLGEQGYFGFALWAALHLMSLIGTARIHRRYRANTDPAEAWIAPFALALQQGHLVYLLGAAFVGIAYQPFILMLLAIQAALATYITRREKARGAIPIFAPLLRNATKRAPA
jgi:probable O-glycosylation ligase (exosortase A-associated)